MNPSILALCALGVLSTACIENSSPKKLKKVELNSSAVDALIGDENVDIKVLNKSVLHQKKLNNRILKPNSKKVIDILAKLPQGEGPAESIASAAMMEQETLLLGLPLGLIGEQNIFGGVITDVSDTNNENLGMLKLTDLTPIHVRPVITGLSTGAPSVTLVGCASNCNEFSQVDALISFPMVGYDEASQTLILDMSAIGQELDLISMLDPNGDFTQLRAIGSATTNVEYSLSTLIFDIRTDMVPVDGSDNSKITSFNVRWYMKLTSGFNPAFETRVPTKGVGFFTTERSAQPKIQRLAAANDGSRVHYYLKGVPERQKKNFSGSIDNWNKEFREIIGRDLLSYEFIDVDDPRYKEIVAGDIRYNVIEWDLNHKAPYAGLGPSIANQYTGEIFSANVLIQGELTEEMYASWYRVSDMIREREAQGKIAEAQKLLKDFNMEVQTKLNKLSKNTFKLKLGKKLEMNVNAQRPELQDQIPRVFELTPEGVSYQEYVDRYMLDTLEHEIGHNLGLRHNFKGTLGAVGGDERGTASRSIMEYLPNLHVIKSGIGEYDYMALSYGYTGKQPHDRTWFCTDEHQVREGSNLKNLNAECNQNDATNDPFEYFRERLNRVTSLLVNIESTDAPVWETKNLVGQINTSLVGMVAYAMSAENTGDEWISFFDKEGRPSDKSQVPAYVVEQIKGTLCNEEIDNALILKSPEAREKALSNLKTASAHMQIKALQLGFNMIGQLSCQLEFKF